MSCGEILKEPDRRVVFNQFLVREWRGEGIVSGVGNHTILRRVIAGASVCEETLQ